GGQGEGGGGDAGGGRASAGEGGTPATIRSGDSVSATAEPSRRNSGFHASSAPGQAELSSAASRRAVPTGTVDLPTTRHGRSSNGASAATQACTWDRSARLLPGCCGVPVQM